MALTFTNKAAKEMKQRVDKLIGQSANDAWIGTFHAICVRILRRDIEKIGYKRSFVIYDDDDQQRVLSATSIKPWTSMKKATRPGKRAISFPMPKTAC
jgi:superfamily I DNA/RNA helicase